MIFLYSIFCQWFARGSFIRCSLDQEKWQVLLMAIFIGYVLTSPIQGDISDKSSRRKNLLWTLCCVVFSLILMLGNILFCPKEYFLILLGVSAILNGVFGNVFPVAAAAYSEQGNNFRETATVSMAARYGGLAVPFILQLPHIYNFFIALTASLISLILIHVRHKSTSERLPNA